MRPLPRFRNLPVTLRVPLVMAGLMILLGFLASQSVLSALGKVQDARLSETARLHVEGLSVALGPSVLRQDVWEVTTFWTVPAQLMTDRDFSCRSWPTSAGASSPLRTRVARLWGKKSQGSKWARFHLMPFA